MTFSNPFTGQIKVLTERLDYYQWPCIAGEPFPPTYTFGSGTSAIPYASQGVYPCLHLNSAGAGGAGSLATWPALPGVAPRTGKWAGHVTTFAVNVHAIEAPYSVVFLSDGYVTLNLAGDGLDSSAAHPSMNGVTLPNLPLDTWATYTWRVAPGGIVLTDPSGVAHQISGSAPAPTAVLQPQARCTYGVGPLGGYSSEIYVTNVRVDWL